jgi:ABC-type oligopeptide transport system substrate-binding subunit
MESDTKDISNGAYKMGRMKMSQAISLQEYPNFVGQ